ncbi:MAG: KilA-N domain-containing protein [Rikenellaceae bacterium]
MAKSSINIEGVDVVLVKQGGEDYISLTDMARYKNLERTNYIIQNWMRTRYTIEFIGLWEKIHNPDFKSIEFDAFRNEAGLNSFVLTPQRWIERTNAIGIISKSGRYGGTYAHKDIAFEFGSWLSADFKLYLIKEYQRLKGDEQKQLGWSAKRELAKINYHIHTDAIKANLIPNELTVKQTSIVYASEADVLNVALYGITAKQWREANPELTGNIRDYSTINELICLSNMENINAVLINEGISQRDRLIKLNSVAIQQMRVLSEVENRKLLK